MTLGSKTKIGCVKGTFDSWVEDHSGCDHALDLQTRPKTTIKVSRFFLEFFFLLPIQTQAILCSLMSPQAFLQLKISIHGRVCLLKIFCGRIYFWMFGDALWIMILITLNANKTQKSNQFPFFVVAGTVCAASSTMIRNSPTKASLMSSRDSWRRWIWWRRPSSFRRD